MINIIDTTLREGEQTPGVIFPLTVRQEIITGLAGLGIDELEIGIASRGNNDLAALCSFMHSVFPQQKFSLWCRCREEDILFAAALQPSALALSIPASDLHLSKKLGKDRSWAISTLEQSIQTALDAGIPKVAVGLEDATRADMHFIQKLALTARTAGAFRLRLADTVGIADPSQIINLFRGLRGMEMELGVHCHNDFGMATANSITALAHGASWADVTLLGLGERAGNSRLEEVLSYLVFQKKTDKYNLEGLQEISRALAKTVGQTISPGRPILGSELFTCETGIHQQGLIADPTTYEPYPPERIGHCRKILIGSKSGRSSIAAAVKRLGLPKLENARLTQLSQKIRNLAGEQNRPLQDDEIFELARQEAALHPALPTLHGKAGF